MLPCEGQTTLTEVPRLLEKAKLSFVLALREAFASSLTHKDLLYSENATDTKMKIYTAHPLRIEFLPILVVSVASGDSSVNYLQDEYTEKGETEEFEIYSGKTSFNIGITTYTTSTLEREKIMDHLIFFIRHLFKGTFRSFDMEYTSGIGIGGESIMEIDNRAVYEQTMNIPCYMEYEAKVDLRALETVRSIIIEKMTQVDLGEEVEDLYAPKL